MEFQNLKFGFQNKASQNRIFFFFKETESVFPTFFTFKWPYLKGKIILSHLLPKYLLVPSVVSNVYIQQLIQTLPAS